MKLASKWRVIFILCCFFKTATGYSLQIDCFPNYDNERHHMEMIDTTLQNMQNFQPKDPISISTLEAWTDLVFKIQQQFESLLRNERYEEASALQTLFYQEVIENERLNQSYSPIFPDPYGTYHTVLQKLSDPFASDFVHFNGSCQNKRREGLEFSLLNISCADLTNEREEELDIMVISQIDHEQTLAVLYETLKERYANFYIHCSSDASCAYPLRHTLIASKFPLQGIKVNKLAHLISENFYDFFIENETDASSPIYATNWNQEKRDLQDAYSPLELAAIHDFKNNRGKVISCTEETILGGGSVEATAGTDSEGNANVRGRVEVNTDSGVSFETEVTITRDSDGNIKTEVESGARYKW